MFVRFTTESGSTAKNYGFQEALKATATANSGFTPSLPGGCIDYQVLSNDEAGGWVENTDWCDPLTSSSDTSGTYAIMSGLTSKDFGVENMSKHLKIQFDQTDGNFEQIYVGSRIPDGTYSANSSPYSKTISSCDSQDDTSHGTQWYLSITSSYCWVWENGAASPNFFGVADLDGVPASYKSVSNYWPPFLWFTSHAGANYRKYLAEYIINGVMSSKRGSSNEGPLSQGIWTSYDCSNAQQIAMYSTAPELTIYSYDATATPALNVYRQSINTNGEYVDSLNPIAMYAPHNNVPYMPIKGIKALGRFSNDSASDVTNAASTYYSYVNKIVYDENGDRYMILHPNPWAPIAIRCV